MNYIFRKIDQTYVVWLEKANRFMQLQEPAFFVFNAWAKGVESNQVILQCSYNYELDSRTARLFVNELISQFETLLNLQASAVISQQHHEPVIETGGSGKIICHYQISGKNYRFCYAHPEMKSLIHSGLRYTEVFKEDFMPDHIFDLFEQGEEMGLVLDSAETGRCPLSKPEQLVGLVNLQLLNCIYSTDDSFWMGAVYASAASSGNGAILFTAPSGSGKSTFAAVLKHNGYKILTDDFSPISLKKPHIYPFPEGISVKARSVDFLASYYPALESAAQSLTEGGEEIIPVSENAHPMPVKAIVFLKYDPSVDLVFKKRNNLEAMDDFLKQLWLPPITGVVNSFMDWFFDIPCYSLRYSDTRKAIKSLTPLFVKGL
ncbi:MAG: hypothetical protein JNK09_10885 [Prolixibacteraceae bacterium]|nr:hypothetical protein [Prolixibacteraceae bacterium]